MTYIDDLEEYDAELELRLKREYATVFGLFRYCVLTAEATYLCNELDIQRNDQAAYPFARLTGPANVLVMPGLHSAHISSRLMQSLGGVTVIAFSTDQQFWRPQSRQIQVGRTDQSGAYRIRALPPGDYLIVATDDVEQGEWFDPAYLEEVRPAAKKMSLTEGEKKSEDLRGPGA